MSKRYGAVRALRDVSLAVEPGSVVGLCGHNGAGKSTLVKALAGLVRPDEGEIRVDGRPVRLRDPQHAQAEGIALVAQELSVVGALTVAENLFLGNIGLPMVMGRRRKHALARTLLDRVGLAHIAPGTPVEDLRMGERQLVEIARLLGRDAQLLILDEPTASLSEVEARRVFAAIRSAAGEGRSVLYVSHRLDEVLDICGHVVILRDGALVATSAARDLDRDKLISLMLGEAGRERADPRASGVAKGAPVSIVGLRVPGRVSDFDLQAQGGQIVGLAGQLGSGVSEVLRACAGLIPDADGEVMIGPLRLKLGSPVRSLNAGFVYVSNDRQHEGLFLHQSIARNLTATRLAAISVMGVLSRRRAAAVVTRLAALVGIDRRRLRSAVADLSGGNQQKVLIGRCLERTGSEVLLLDDPTRGVDVGGRADIHRLMRHAAADGAFVLFASSEIDEVLELSDLIVTMARGGVVSRLSRGQADMALVLGDVTGTRREAAST